jgi:dihydrofolate reductase
MRRLILEEWISLDGFAVDREGTLDFFPASEEDRFSDKDQLEFLESVDTIVLGRRTYELFVDFWPTATTDEEVIADRLNALPKLVFSNTLRDAPGERGNRRESSVATPSPRSSGRSKMGSTWSCGGASPLPRASSRRTSSTNITSSSVRRWSGAGGRCSPPFRTTRTCIA